MFKFFKKYKSIVVTQKSFKKRFSGANKTTKNRVYKLFYTGLFLTFLSSTLIWLIGGFSNNHTWNNRVIPEESVITEEHTHADHSELIEDAKGIPNPLEMLNPFNGLKDSILEGLSTMTQEAVEPFDDYVGFTPNIGESDGQILNSKGEPIRIGVNKFYKLTSNIAWALLPLIIAVYGCNLLLEDSLNGRQLIKQLGKKVLLFCIGMIAMRFCFSVAIELTNAINKSILQNIIGINGDSTLSKSLISALGMTMNDEKLSLSIQGVLNFFAEILIWFALFIFLITILFQFIIRFFHLLAHLIMFPIIAVVGLLPNGGQLFKSYLEETWRILATQPIFLIGLGIVIEVIASIDKPVAKVILGLGSLAFLNLIPTLVNKLSGFLWSSASRATNDYISRKGTLPLKGIAVAGAMASGVGSKIMSNLPIKSFSKVSNLPNKTTHFGENILGKSQEAILSNQSKSGAFKQGLKESKGNPTKAFAKVGMTPLGANSLKPETDKASLFTTVPNFSALDNISLKDRDSLSAKFVKDNHDPALGEYPLTESPVELRQLSDIRYFQPSNPNTDIALNNVIEQKPTEIKLGKTFDNTNSEHWNHITQWYAKNESLNTGQPISHYEEFTKNPVNKMDIIRKASNEGYFSSQGIKTVKVTDKLPDQKPIVKYYQSNLDISKPQFNKNFKSKNYARNSATKAE